jgi:hypothetical protein
MSFSKADLPELQWSISALVVSLALSGGIISLSNTYIAHSLQGRQAAQQQLAGARAQLLSAQSDQENMSAYALEYDALKAQKVIGDEPRLDWIEGLEKLREQGVVLDFKYTIEPQQSYAPNPPLDAGNFKLSRSSMKLDIDMLHEQQLLNLFGDMRRQIKGWFILDGCTISRSSETEEMAPLKAECTGGWFTMKDKNAP